MKITKISAEYRDHMGTDLTVVDAARASFGKESAWLPSGSPNDYPGVVYQHHGGRPVNLKKEDAGLIRFLATGYRAKEWDEFLDQIIDCARNGGKEGLTDLLHAYKRRAQHWAPFAHPKLQIRMKLPLFLARQFVKHQVGGEWSEESRRYMSSEPEFWFPTNWQKRPEDIKQGASGLADNQGLLSELSFDHTEACLATYLEFLARGVAPEEARIHLPLNTMTTVVWTGSLLFWSRVHNQRVDSHAQLAAQELGSKIGAIVGELFPVSWKALTT